MEVYKSNIQKWENLPAGRSQYNVNSFSDLNDVETLKLYNDWIIYWENERAWEYEFYKEYFKDKDVIEIGSGLGYDGIRMSQIAKSWTFCDINENNINFVKRICKLKNITNVDFKVIDDPLNYDFGKQYNALWSHGVLHHIPIEFAKKEYENINKYLENDSKIMLLMYPKERWEKQGKMSFTTWGNLTDGGCPWIEYYTEEKILQLVGSEYKLIDTQYPEKPWKYAFVNYLLKKKNI